MSSLSWEVCSTSKGRQELMLDHPMIFFDFGTARNHWRPETWARQLSLSSSCSSFLLDYHRAKPNNQFSTRHYLSTESSIRLKMVRANWSKCWVCQLRVNTTQKRFFTWCYRKPHLIIITPRFQILLTFVVKVQDVIKLWCTVEFVLLTMLLQRLHCYPRYRWDLGSGVRVMSAKTSLKLRSRAQLHNTALSVSVFVLTIANKFA